MEQSKQNEILTVAREAIRTEADALEKMERSLDEHFVEAIEMILQSRGKLIITGMGKSGLIGRKMAATFASTGTPSFYLHPGEAFHGDLGMISKEDIVLAISYSGETDEVLKIVPFIHNNGNRLISMTGNPASTLAIHSDIHLDVSVDHEACILHLAPTTSTTAQIAMGDAMAVALMKMRNFSSNDFARLHPGGSLGRRLLATVGDVMRSDNLPVVGPDCTAKDMIHTISRCGLGLIVVCEGDRIEGIVTDGDIRRAMERSGADFINLRAADILTRDPKRIHPEEKLIEAEKMMTRHKITSLLVTDRDERLAGVIQIYDIKLGRQLRPTDTSGTACGPSRWLFNDPPRRHRPRMPAVRRRPTRRTATRSGSCSLCRRRRTAKIRRAATAPSSPPLSGTASFSS